MLAPGEQAWMYPPIDDDVRDLLGRMATCREPTCLVVQNHPYYHDRVPCMPVVPVYTNRGKVLVVGNFPTARFVARSAGDQPVSFADGARNHLFAPVADTWSPLQDAAYFDGYKVRYNASGRYFRQHYLEPLGIDPEKHVWMTNMIKCFLFAPENVRAYRDLGWIDKSGLKVDITRDEKRPDRDHLLEIAETCWTRWLADELVTCQPRLVLTLGMDTCTVVHRVDADDPAAQRRAYTKLLGVPLRRNVPAPEEVAAGLTRKPPWLGYNVFHMLHPQSLLMAESDIAENENVAAAKRLQARHRAGVDALRLFLQELHLPA